MPNNPKGGGISRRIAGEERSELREAMADLKLDPEHALIARTAGIGKSGEELQWDLDFLVQLWAAIERAATDRPAPFLVYQESNLIVRAIRDYLRSDIDEIVIDEAEIFERAKKFMDQVMPQNLVKLKHYEDTIPLFSRFQIEHQIETAFSNNVTLPSGGGLVIDHTEAIVAVDVNSARATKGSDIEETALQTNLEAVDEMARQLRIRDLGGLIVIDLIDMTSPKNNRTVEARLQEAVKPDRARIQIGRISRFGLLEMSRQRLRSSISESNYRVCPLCDGSGHIRNVTSSALSFLRILEEEALKENTEAIHAQLPIDIATYLLNEKRHEINQIESRLATRLIIIPAADLNGSQFRIRRLRAEEMDDVGNLASHEIQLPDDDKASQSYEPAATQAETPEVSLDSISTSKPPPASRAKEPEKSDGFLSRVWRAIAGGDEAEKKTAETESKPAPTKSRDSESRGQRRGGSRGGGQKRGGSRSTRSAEGRQSGGRRDGSRRSSGGQEQKGAKSRRGKRRGSGQDDTRSRSRETGAEQAKSASNGDSSTKDRGGERKGSQGDGARRSGGRNPYRNPRGGRGNRQSGAAEKDRTAASSTTDTASSGQPTDSKRAAEKPSTDKPSAEKPRVDKPGGDKPTVDKPNDNRPSNDGPSGEKPRDRSVADKPDTQVSAAEN